jgi:hypothetical protein
VRAFNLKLAVSGRNADASTCAPNADFSVAGACIDFSAGVANIDSSISSRGDNFDSSRKLDYEVNVSDFSVSFPA